MLAKIQVMERKIQPAQQKKQMMKQLLIVPEMMLSFQALLNMISFPVIK